MPGRNEAMIPLESHSAHDPKRCGAKAATLARAKAAGFPVLDGWILPADVDLTDAVKKAIALKAKAYEEWIVRSTALDEDGSEMSQAGRYRSERCSGSQVVEAIGRVRASGSPAVLLQCAVDGPGGVYLSQDPAAPNKPLLMLAREGVDRITSGLDFTQEMRSCIVESLYRLSRKLEIFLQCPVDVELCWNDGPILFQVRPQTALVANDPLHEYFPHRMPDLALAIWADIFYYAFGEKTVIRGGRLYSSGESASDHDPDTPVDIEAEEVARKIPALRDELAVLTEEVESRSTKNINGIDGWVECYNAWRKLLFRYFNNPVQRCMEEARRRAPKARERDPVTSKRISDLQALHERLASHTELARILEIGGVRELLKHPLAPEELRYYLEEWGAWSEYPEDFSRPYLDEDPSLLNELLRAPSGLIPSFEMRPMETWEEIACFGEEDNAFKYKGCRALRIATISLGNALMRQGFLPSEDDVWSLSLLDLCEGKIVLLGQKGTDGEAMPDATYRGKHLPCEAVLSQGRVEGTVWFGEGTVPTDPILVTEALGQGARDLLRLVCVRGVICRYGNAASHGAIIAREKRVAVVRSSAALDTLKLGDRVLVDALRGVVVRIPSEGGG